MRFTSTPVRMVLTRDVSNEECPWLRDGLKLGEVLWTYHGHTYGAIDTINGLAMSREPNQGPFFQVPRTALKEQQ